MFYRVYDFFEEMEETSVWFMLMAALSFGSGILVLAVVDGVFSFVSLYDYAVVLGVTSPVMALSIIGLRWITDTLIHGVSCFITDGRYPIKGFFYRMIFADFSYVDEEAEFLAQWYIIVICIGGVSMLITVPGAWIAGLVIGAVVALMYLSRSVFRVTMKLSDHKSDPKAHTNTGDSK